MTLNEAMHAECERCGDTAMNHRMTEAGNFYCLEFTTTWARTVYPIITDRRNAAMRAKCNDLKKSRSLSSMKDVAKVIKEQWLSYIGEPGSHEQLSI